MDGRFEEMDERMNGRFEEMNKKFERKWKEMNARIEEKICGSENRMMVIMEQLRHDLIGTHKDKIFQHEDRITKLEMHAGLCQAA